jgi:hypothetical protein
MPWLLFLWSDPKVNTDAKIRAPPGGSMLCQKMFEIFESVLDWLKNAFATVCFLFYFIT